MTYHVTQRDALPDSCRGVASHEASLPWGTTSFRESANLWGCAHRNGRPRAMRGDRARIGS